MTAGAVAAAAGFLLGVLWMDLMFDSQARSGVEILDGKALSSIAGYYHRATTTSAPRGLLIAATMVALLVLIAVDAATGGRTGWPLAASVALAGGPILLAVLHTVPAATRLGRSTDTPEVQSRLARTIYRDHRICLTAMSAFLALWLLTGLSSN